MNRLQLLKAQLVSAKAGNTPPQFKLLNLAPSSISPKVKIVTINSPQNLNALSPQLISELITVFEYLSKDESTKVIIITGSGKAFISGADIKSLGFSTPQSKVKTVDDFPKVSDLFYTIKKPVIAAVNGICFGGGLEMALMCDIILASEKAQIGLPEIKLGLFPGLGGTQKLTKVFGYNKACEYILSGKSIPLQEANSLGLINHIYKHEELLGKAELLGKEIAEFSLLTLISAKQAIQFANEVGLKHGLMYEKAIFDMQFGFADAKEGIKAFIEKRKPNFKDE